jgi:hypothetical protein
MSASGVTNHLPMTRRPRIVNPRIKITRPLSHDGESCYGKLRAGYIADSRLNFALAYFTKY